MNRRNTWLLLPTMILPYVILLTAATVFFSTENSLFWHIVERVFKYNGFALLSMLLIFCLCAFSLSVTHFVLSIRKKWDALSLAKIAMCIKWVQVPAYILIFILSLMCAITLFTIPFVFVFAFLDCLTLLLTGLLTISAAVNTMRQGIFHRKEILLIIILQFVFCLDVFAATVFYRKLRKHSHFDQDDRQQKGTIQNAHEK